jgi:hypothetical protein
VNHQLFALIALTLAQERARERADEANRDRLARQAVDALPASPSLLRRSLARGLAAVSLGSASVVRRLDSCIADDLGRSLAPTE